MNQWTLRVCALAISLPAMAEPASPATEGAVVAPVVLPSGAAASYGFVGVPEVGAGYRQGVGPIELEARIRFNYFDVSFAGEGLFKYRALQGLRWDVAPLLGVGLIGNSGTRYINPANFQYGGVRILPGALASFRALDSLVLLSELDVPVDFGFSGGSRISPLLGGGAELMIGQGVSCLVLAQAGFDALEPANGPSQLRFSYQVKLGLGWRLF